MTSESPGWYYAESDPLGTKGTGMDLSGAKKLWEAT